MWVILLKIQDLFFLGVGFEDSTSDREDVNKKVNDHKR